MPRIIERVNEYIPSWFRRNKATAKVLAGIYSLSARVGGRFGKQLQSAVRMYRDKTVDPSALRKDMIKEFVRAWVRPVEYAKFDRHPDTNVSFSGVQIPMWSELCSLVKQIHLEHKGQMVFGFDMAWTDKGWDLVEVNPAPSLNSYQELTGEGIRHYLKRLNMI